MDFDTATAFMPITGGTVVGRNAGLTMPGASRAMLTATGKNNSYAFFGYSRRSAWSRICPMLLVLLLGALPLNGVQPSEPSVLVTLRTVFVPFDASLEAASPIAFQLSVLAALGKHVTSSPVSAFRLASPDCHLGSDHRVDGLAPSPFALLVRGRSPPFAS
jgi:hypothetical protein